MAQYLDNNNNVHACRDRTEHFQYLNNNFIKNFPIDFLEFGVYKGDSIISWSRMNTHDLSKFYGFDTFTGLPEDWFKGFEKNAFDMGGKLPQTNDSRSNLLRETSRIL